MDNFSVETPLIHEFCPEISRMNYMALKLLVNKSERTLLYIGEQTLSLGVIQLIVRWYWVSLCTMWQLHSSGHCAHSFFTSLFFFFLSSNNSIIVDLPTTLVNQCEASLKRLQILCPQFYLDGKNSVWIVKPGAKSRGRGFKIFLYLIKHFPLKYDFKIAAAMNRK